jgi:IS5 family transposase
MRPRVWQPPVEVSAREAAVVKRIHRAKLFVFLREQRHELFSAAFQEELGALLYAEAVVGHPPIPPAQLALATLLQAYTGVSDDEVIEALVMDRRWQVVLDCLDSEQPPFSKATLVAFRQRLIAADGDRLLVERTVALAAARGGFGSRALRAALDSSPLWGAGRVEDTYNLLGHALRKAMSMLARQQGRGLTAMPTAAPVLNAPVSVKAALDLDWDDPAARSVALRAVLDALSHLEDAAAAAEAINPAVTASVAIAQTVRAQDVVLDEHGQPTLRRGVAPDRRISVEDAQMRHGRKSRSQRVDGYKRHVLADLDTGLIRAVGLTPANVPEASVTDALLVDLAAQGVARDTLAELHIDRAYLSSQLVRERAADLTIYCKAWPVRNGDRFAKTAFTLDWAAERLHCPAGASVPFAVGTTVHFPARCCGSCLYRERCTTSAHGRSVHIHPNEQLLEELRERQHTTAGRAALRARVGVEHALARIGQWQGDRARYRGLRKNLFDLRRMAVVSNLHDLMRLPDVPRAA